MENNSNVLETYNYMPIVPEEADTGSSLGTLKQFFGQKHQQEKTYGTWIK